MTFEHYKMARNRIDRIMLDFDFEMVHRIMEMMDWRWASWEDEEYNTHENEVPSVYALRSEALKLMIQCLDKQSGIQTGGFRIQFGSDEDEWFDENACYMSLEFIAVEDSEY